MKSRTFDVPIPKVRDAFINAPLVSVGPGKDGEERFWISSCNITVGSIGVLITESGKVRIYRFPNGRYGCLYSAVAEDQDTLWLCGDLSFVVRLDLKSGKFKEYPTGAPYALVFQGMAFDRATGKLFAGAFPTSTYVTTAFSFDCRKRKTVKVYENICEDHYMRFSFPNGDGSHSFVFQSVSETIVRWDPAKETVESRPLEKRSDGSDAGTTLALVADSRNRWYFPSRGWFNRSTKQFEDASPRPSREATWFGRIGEKAWGLTCGENDAIISRWNLVTGEVSDVCTIPDGRIHSATLSKSGKVVAVNFFGVFYRFDGETGALEVTKTLPTESYGPVFCVRRIDDKRLIGTPFSIQRFWEVNILTGKGSDCGRAAPGCGEVLQTWRIGKLAYMAAYTGGELVEYDPDRPARFPENPRVVADPPGGMRPVAAADDGRNIFYSCSRSYGHLGSVLTRYDTRTGESIYKADPLPDQGVQSLVLDRASKTLFAGTTMHADCRSCPPSSDLSYFAKLNPEDLSVIQSMPAPKGTFDARVHGLMGKGGCLAVCYGDFPGGFPWFVFDAKNFVIPDVSSMQRVPKHLVRMIETGVPGFFIQHVEDRLELWDMRKPKCVDVLRRGFKEGQKFEAHDGSVYLLYGKKLTILEGCLKGLC